MLDNFSLESCLYDRIYSVTFVVMYYIIVFEKYVFTFTFLLLLSYVYLYSKKRGLTWGQDV